MRRAIAGLEGDHALRGAGGGEEQGECYDQRMSMPKRVQAKHVEEAPILRALASHRAMTHWYFPHDPACDSSWSLPAQIEQLRAVPERVLLAKLGAMMRRGLIDGCACGCRGDWTLTDKGRQLLQSA